MDKEKIFKQLKDQIKTDLQLAYDAAKNTYDIATHEENKAENKYDTRGLEASYLAGAQAERVADIQQTLGVFEIMNLKKFKESDRVALGALLELTSENKTLFLFVMPRGGGLTLKYEGQLIQVITPESPLGQNLIGKELGDEVQVKTTSYEITNLI